jgi:hypothetical protein
MKSAHYRRLLAVATVGLMGLGLAGCPSKSNAHNDSNASGSAAGDHAAGQGAAKDVAKWIGTYAQQGKDKMILVLQADHKGSMAPAGEKGDITWEVAGDDKITIDMGMPFTMVRTADGNLRDDEGVVWKKTK